MTRRIDLRKTVIDAERIYVCRRQRQDLDSGVPSAVALATQEGKSVRSLR